MSTGTEAGQRRRRRVRLTALRQVPVPFTGQRAGEGPLTFGQLDVYLWTSSTPNHPHATLYASLPVPAMATVDDVAGAVAALIARHESLRTTFVPGKPPRQRVAASGVHMLEVCSLGEGQWGPPDQHPAAAALIRRLRESPDPGRRPVRIAVAIAPGAGDRVIACAAGLAHVAVDHGALEVLKRDFAALLADPGRRQAGPPGHQPLDQARLEATPAERHRAEAALDRMRELSLRTPRCLYAVPGARPSGESLAVELSSPAAAMATARVAARTRTSRSAIVLAAICAVIARRANYPELVLPLVSSNRFESHLADYVGPLAQGTLVTVEVAGRSFDELAGHTWTAVMEANRLARYDTAQHRAMERLLGHERGLRLDNNPMFNSLVRESWSGLTAGVGVQPGQIDVALGRTELRWRPMSDTGAPVRFSLSQVDGSLLLEAWIGDTGLLPRAELEQVLLAIERLLVAAAPGDVPACRIPGVIALEPIPGTPDRMLIDHCWIEIADVQRLLDDALAPAVARVFASAGGRPLVAYLAATDAIRTPEQAHARCAAALPRHPTASTPRHYVICAAVPSDPADPAAWPPPLAAGTGRAG